MHRAIGKIVPYRYLSGPQLGEVPPWVIHTPDWPYVAAHIIG